MFSYSNISLVSLRVCLCLFGVFSSNSYLMNNSCKFYFRFSCQTATKASKRRYHAGAILGISNIFNSSTDLFDRAAWISVVPCLGLCPFPLVLRHPLPWRLTTVYFWRMDEPGLIFRWSCHLNGEVSPSFLLTANSGITLLSRNVRQIDLASLKHWNSSLNLKHQHNY